MQNTISVVIRKHTSTDGRTFFGATAKGRYLIDRETVEEFEKGQFHDVADLQEVVGKIAAEDLDKNMIIKITQKSGVTWPTEEGIYRVTFEGSMWVDDRPTEDKRADKSKPALKVVRLNGSKFEFSKTHDLKPVDKPTETK